MKQSIKNISPENLIFFILWLLVFTMPIFLSSNGSRIDWLPVMHQLIRISPFFLIFLLNNFVLFGFIKNKEISKYLIFTTIAIIFISILGSFNNQFFDLLNIPKPPRPPGPMGHRGPMLFNNIFFNSIFSILVIGLNNAVKMAFRFLQDNRDFEQLQKENLKNQLSLLQHQINPHFFMNTLNNIHVLIDYDKEMAKNSVLKLSKLMRVLLYENENFTLEKEIIFLNDYLELMKIRVNENVDIKFEFPETIPQVNFPPLLFLSFVENSFKHGILAIGKSFIHISFTIENNILNVKIINSKPLDIKHDKASESIGLSNSKKRFDLIYGKNYNFEIIETQNTFEVNIKIPLNNNDTF